MVGEDSEELEKRLTVVDKRLSLLNIPRWKIITYGAVFAALFFATIYSVGTNIRKKRELEHLKHKKLTTKTMPKEDYDALQARHNALEDALSESGADIAKAGEVNAACGAEEERLRQYMEESGRLDDVLEERKNEKELRDKETRRLEEISKRRHAYQRRADYCQIAREQARAGRREDAIKSFRLAMGEAVGHYANNGYANIAIDMAELGFHEEAKEAALRINRKNDWGGVSWGRAWKAIAAAKAKAGKHDEAMEIAESMEEGFWESMTYSATARAYAEAGNLERAVMEMEKITYPPCRLEVHLSIAVSYARSEEWDNASKHFQSAIEETNKEKGSSTMDSDRLLVEYVSILAENRMYEEAERIAGINLGHTKPRAYLEIVEAEARAGLYGRAKRNAEKIDDDTGLTHYRSRAFYEIVSAMAGAGKTEQAIETSEHIKRRYIPAALFSILLGYVREGRNEEAQRLIGEAVEEVAFLTRKHGELYANFGVIRMDARNGTYSNAKRFADAGNDKDWRHRAYRASAYLAIAGEQLKAGKTKEAENMLEEATEIIRHLGPSSPGMEMDISALYSRMLEELRQPKEKAVPAAAD